MAKSKKGGPAPKSDAYVGLLFIALLAQIAAGVFLYMEYSTYPEAKPPSVQRSPDLNALQQQPGPGPGPGPEPMPPGPMPPGPMPMPPAPMG